MENQNEEVLDDGVQDEQPEDKTATLEAELEKQRGINKRLSTKLKKVKEAQEEPETPPEPEKKVEELDLMQLAYLENKGYETDEEIEFVKSVMKRTGEDVRTVLKDDYVLNKLKSIKDAKEVLEATPSGTKTAPQGSAKNTVEYWLAKGGLPKDDHALATKVLNARIEKEKSGAKFYNS